MVNPITDAMESIARPVAGGIFALGSKIIDRFFPDPTERDKAKLELLRMQQEGELRELEVSMKAIIAEANSQDPWTSRARPSFMYVFYFILLVLVIFFPLIGIAYPAQMAQFYTNVGAGFKAIPEEIYWLFGVGYLGYTGARTLEKRK